MTTFDDRESAYETKFVHDQDLAFKAEARANKMLAIWAAEKLGKTGDAIQAYVVEVIKADFEEAGHEDVIRKVAGDLKGVASEDEIRAKRSECHAQAIKQIEAEG